MMFRAMAVPRVLRIAFIVAIVGTACGAQAGPSSNDGTTAAQRAIGATVRHYESHSDRAEINTPAAMCQSLYVEAATVRSLGPSHWNSASRTAPTGDLDNAVHRFGYLIYTPVNRSDTRMLVDHRSVAATEYVEYGGELAAASMQDDAYPQLHPGQRYILVFVPTIQAGSGRVDPSTLIAHNAFPILAGDQVQLRQQTTEQGVVTQQEVRIALADLAAELKVC